MIRLETLIELRFLHSSFSSSDFSIRAFRAQISQFELFELVLLLKLDKQFTVEQFEATVSQSTGPSPPLRLAASARRRACGVSRCAARPRHELRYSYPYPCPKKLYELPAVLFFATRACSANRLGHGHGYECRRPTGSPRRRGRRANCASHGTRPAAGAGGATAGPRPRPGTKVS